MPSQHPMHVHLYKVTRTENLAELETLLPILANEQLEGRIRKVSLQEMRLENAIAPDDDCGLWRLDFCKFRDDGPGRASRQKAAESFALQDGEHFAEETAALYDPDSKALVLQYNHHGPRATAIADYLSIYAGIQNERYSLLLQLNPSAQARLATKKRFTRLEYKVAPAKLSADWKQQNVSMFTAMEKTQQVCGGDWISVSISLEDRSANTTLKLKDKLKGLLGLANEPREAVDKLLVAGVDEQGTKIDPVDLLEESLVRTYKGLPRDAGKRIPVDNRWRSLQDAYNVWKQNGLI